MSERRAGGHMIHELKTVQPHYNNITYGKKRLEIRFDDRGYEPGDWLHLQLYDAEKETYVGLSTMVRVDHVLRDFDGLAPGWVAMSVRVLS